MPFRMPGLEVLPLLGDVIEMRCLVLTARILRHLPHHREILVAQFRLQRLNLMPRIVFDAIQH